MGDESSSVFQIGYTYFKEGLWYETFSLDGNGNGYFRGKLEVSSELYVNNGWVRVSGDRGLYFQDHGGGFYMNDNKWIKTWGNKSFFHNAGIMRTDGIFQVGNQGNRFVVNSNGNVGIGNISPNNKLEISDAFSFHSGGHKVIGLGYSISHGSMLNGYVGELRWDPNLGSFSVGSTSNSCTTGQTGISLKTRFLINNNGNVGIGTISPSAKLEVSGDILADEIRVEDIAASNLNLSGNIAANNITVKANGNTADFVFADDYAFKSLTEVDNYIKEHKHLPEIPSAEEMENKGVNLAEMNKLLLQKVEELTLYQIEKDKEVKELKERLLLIEKFIKTKY